MKRRSMLGLGLAAGMAPLAACGGNDDTSGTPATSGSTTSAAPSGGSDSSSGGGSATMVVWVDGTRYPVVKPLADQFMKDNPGVTIKVVQKNFSDIGTQFSTQVPTGKGPDVAIIPHDGIGGMVKSGVVAPLELGDLKDKMNPLAVAGFTVDGQVYGLPYAIENLGMVRNNKLTKDTPKTWDDAVASGKKAGQKYAVLQAVGKDGNPYNMYPLEASFGSHVFKLNPDGSSTETLTIGDAAGKKFAQWLHDEGNKGKKTLDVNMSGDVAKAQFLAGKGAYFITGPWDLADMDKKKMDYDILPIPSAGGKPAAPFLGIQGFILSSKSKNSLLATQFLVNYMGTKDVQLALFKGGQRVPALTEAAEDPTVTQNKAVQGFAEAGKEGIPMPNVPAMAQVWTFWGGAEAQIVSGKDPAKTWATMTKNIAAAIKKNS